LSSYTVENRLSSMAFVTPVPRQEDVGHDLLCTLAERDGRLIRAGPFFTVQVKSDREDLVFEKEHELDWIKNQENPFFLCIADRESLTIELYSTWNMLNGFLAKKAPRVVLVPGGPNDECGKVDTQAGPEQVIPLGKPVLRISVQDAMNKERAHDLSMILRDWVLIDRQNIVNRGAGMYWVVGPVSYDTNLSPMGSGQTRVAFYWNAKNLRECLLNFGRATTALRLVLALGVERERLPDWAHRIEGVEQVLGAFSDYLEPLAKKSLKKQVGLDVDKIRK
jgi:hypothetical protein